MHKKFECFNPFLNYCSSLLAPRKQDIDLRKLGRKRSVSQSQLLIKKTKLSALRPTDVAIILHTSGIFEIFFLKFVTICMHNKLHNMVVNVSD